MASIAAAGSSEFILGFQLAGVRETIELKEDFFPSLKDLKKREDLAIVVIEESLLEGLDSSQRHEIESSIEPVFVPLSVNTSQDSLRKLIKKSVGIDLWK